MEDDLQASAVLLATGHRTLKSVTVDMVIRNIYMLVILGSGLGSPVFE